MLELIIDTPDREDDALQALLAIGISAEQGDCVNTIRIPESSRVVAELCMKSNDIEYQFSCNENGDITVY